MGIFTRAFSFNLQSSPINQREIIGDIFPPLPGMAIRVPSSDQIINILNDKSGITGTHQLYGLERSAPAADKWLATFIEAKTAAAMTKIFHKTP